MPKGGLTFIILHIFGKRITFFDILASTLVDFLQDQTLFSVCVKKMFNLMLKYKNDNKLIEKKVIFFQRFITESLNYKFMFQDFPKITLTVEDKFF